MALKRDIVRVSALIPRWIITRQLKQHWSTKLVIKFFIPYIRAKFSLPPPLHNNALSVLSEWYYIVE